MYNFEITAKRIPDGKVYCTFVTPGWWEGISAKAPCVSVWQGKGVEAKRKERNIYIERSEYSR